MTHFTSPHARVLTGALLGGLLQAGTARPAYADTLAHCDFSDVSALAFNGSADQLGNDLELTTPDDHLAGSAYDLTPVSWSTTTSFHTSFQFVLENTGGAEGIAFILQNASLTALGGDTGEMGYGNIAASIEVEFDTYKDTWDPNDNHVGIMENGAYRNHLVSATPAFTMAGGGMLYAWIDYDAGSSTLSVYLSQSSSKPSSPLASTVVDVATDIGTMAFAGFTAATGGGGNVNEQDVLEWELSTDGIPCVCAGGAECPVGMACSASTGLCVVAVTTPDAGTDAGTPVADAGAAPDALADAASNACVTNASCDSNLDSKTPICGALLTCEPCSEDFECVAPLAPFCAMSGAHVGQCVSCTANSECTMRADAGEHDADVSDAGTIELTCVDDGLTNVCATPDAGAHHDAGGARDAGVDATPPHDAGSARLDAGSNGESFAGGACSCRTAGRDGQHTPTERALLFVGLLGLVVRRKILSGTSSCRPRVAKIPASPR